MATAHVRPPSPNGHYQHHNIPPQHQSHINGMQAQQQQQQQQAQQAQQAQQGPPPPPPQHQQAPPQPGQAPPGKVTPQHLAQANEAVWVGIGNLSELMGDLDGAMQAYERALHHNQYSIPAMNQISCILRTKELFPRAVEYLQAILKLDPNNGEVWGSLGHCFLMMEDLQQAYTAYQQALYHLKDPKEPKLWYGIGILYDRYGSLEHAEEAFSQVMRMQPDFEKANEIYFRLGIIYKQQQKFSSSLECFKYIVHDPPRPLTEEDIWFQIGHVHEQQKDYDSAKAAYRRVLDRDPKHAKVLQQLGWLHHQQSNSFQSQEQAIDYLEQSVSSDNNDAQSWYLLGRCYMSQQKYSKAYEAYQQAVYRDGRNPTFWCSIGVLYYQINQYRDALDAYSRAIRLNPYISEVWYDLGTLYESCNNQTNDALDAYQRAADLDPGNHHIKARLQLLRNNQAAGVQTHQAAPAPQDVHPQQYQAASVGGPPGTGPQWGPASAGGPNPRAQGAIENWNQQLAPVDRNPQPPRPANPYEQSDHRSQQQQAPPPPPPPQQQQQQQQAPPPSHTAPRHPSPRNDPMRGYQEHRGAPPRRPSPAPPAHSQAGAYPGQTLPAPPPQPPQHQQQQSSQGPPPRITNPNYVSAGLNTPPAGQSGQMPPMDRRSPPPEIRPLANPPDQKQSPNTQAQSYNRDGYNQQPVMPPAPTAALQAAEAQAQRDRDERPPGAYKRPPEEDDHQKGPNKKPANGEALGRHEEPAYQRTPPKTERPPTPPHLKRRSSSESRRQQADQNYHPSEAAHHPPTLPAIQHPSEQSQSQAPPSQAQPSPSAQQNHATSQIPSANAQQVSHPPPPPPPAERPQEGAARKDPKIDDDYNDTGEEEQRANTTTAKTESSSLPNGQPKAEPTA